MGVQDNQVVDKGFEDGKLDERELDDQMSQLGEQGWGLLSSLSTLGSGTTHDVADCLSAKNNREYRTTAALLLLITRK